MIKEDRVFQHPDKLTICTMNVSKDHLEYLERIAQEKNYPTRSAFLRDMVIEFIDIETQLDQLLGKTQDCDRIVTINLPKSKIQQLDDLVKKKRYFSRSEVLRSMLRDILITLLPKKQQPMPVVDINDPMLIQVGDKIYKKVIKSC